MGFREFLSAYIPCEILYYQNEKPRFERRSRYYFFRRLKPYKSIISLNGALQADEPKTATRLRRRCRRRRHCSVFSLMKTRRISLGTTGRDAIYHRHSRIR